MSVSAAVVRAIAARSALALRRKSLRTFRPCQSSLSVDSIEATDPGGDGSAAGLGLGLGFSGAQRVTPLAPIDLARVTSSARASATGSSMLPGGGGWRSSPRVVAPFSGSSGLDRPGLAGDANAAVSVLLFVPFPVAFSFSSPARGARFFTFRGVRLSPSAKVRVPNGAFHHASASSSSSYSDPVPSDDVDSSPASRPVGSAENFANLPGVRSTALNLSSGGSSRRPRALRSSSTAARDALRARARSPGGVTGLIPAFENVAALGLRLAPSSRSGETNAGSELPASLLTTHSRSAMASATPPVP
mmetsp:Transcript_3445/g.14047  ORF Transcript_3445/g.14047 Transcript_3445/m.14047 type:complete len:304 (-) Transcript_3445:648-1559(-)